MKVYNIGRGEENDIVLYDDTGMVSRKHAILKTRPLGKYILIDVSKNGTTVNGRRIPPKQPVKVGRKDVVSFAKKTLLEWKEVPREHSVPLIISACALAAGLVCLLVWFAMRLFPGGDHSTDAAKDDAVEEMATDRSIERRDSAETDGGEVAGATEAAEEEITLIGADGIEFTDRPVVKEKARKKGGDKKSSATVRSGDSKSGDAEKGGTPVPEEESKPAGAKKKVRRS